MSSYLITKVLNNNVIICTKDKEEYVLIAKGIGFNKKAGMSLQENQTIEKAYILDQKLQQEHYKTIIEYADDTLIQAVIDAVNIITSSEMKIDNQTLVVSVTDHIIFAYKRLKQNQIITNPFVVETKQLYSEAYAIAEKVIERLNDVLDVNFPEDEIGFIALHIASNIETLSMHEIEIINHLINKSIFIVEHDLKFTVDKESVQYQRFIRHIQFLIRRLRNGEVLQKTSPFEALLKEQYPQCFNIALKIMKMLQQELNVSIYEAEVIYLTLHVYHFTVDKQ
ncbi:transcriptional regulator [Staphylococcus succinus]|uniref:glucose PTS transporter transcription antiterminator GlcT n=1 Tax=Staphylococcus succinus TaxID=61015 RepID=UPI000C348CBE|nr:transcription antiterminator [Staphylococcus succinus]MBU0437525.1 transcription antiterminator [Staphylococcus succinus]PKI23093.1 transcriptional regulator [Staphylococcus succinus]PTI46543.1 transcription antiterminator [Staphylococcus succinus]PTJ82131.1 transcription antiterminator [Staphylococcus succinus]RIN26498.1 transcription antiterminator [Staphylococcus succinus]